MIHSPEEENLEHKLSDATTIQDEPPGDIDDSDLTEQVIDDKNATGFDLDMSYSSMDYPVTAVVGELNKLVHDSDDTLLRRESSRKMASFVYRMRNILHQLDNVRSPELPSPIQTALTGITADLHQLRTILHIFKSKSSIYLLTHCKPLNKELEDITHSLGKWLALLAIGLDQDSKLRQKTEDLSLEMKHIHFMVTDTEERICEALDNLDKESQGFMSDKAVQNAVMLDIARALGMNVERNQNELTAQMNSLKRELQDSSNPLDLQIMNALETIFKNWSTAPNVMLQPVDADDEENDPIPSFKTFFCPLTKQVMRHPVVLITEQTYEQSAIKKWFNHCLQQGREPTCPVTGQILTSLDLRPNIGLQQTIQEWFDRNIEIRIEKVKLNLQVSACLKDFEQGLDDVSRISEESPPSRHKLRNEGFIPLILGAWQRQIRSSSLLRSKALTALHRMAVNNDENKVAMVEANTLKYAIKSLTSNSEQERESTVNLLMELSQSLDICAKIGSEKGAILFLSVVAANLEDIALSSLAEQILKRLEEVDLNVLPLAEAGRLKPLLDRLCEGSVELQVQMAEFLSEMTLLNNAKELVARRGAKVLVNMLSSNVREKEAALKALLNLSKLDDNAPILINAGILPPLMKILIIFDNLIMPSSTHLKEMAAEMLANLVSKPGPWEVAIVDSDGNTLQSEKVIHNLLGLATRFGYNWKPKLLHALYGISSSPQATDAAVTYLCSGNGIPTLVIFMQDREAEIRMYALKLLSVLSVKMGTELVTELRRTGQLAGLKDILRGSGKYTLEERIAAADIFSNIPLTESEVVQVLEVEMVGWIVAGLKEPGGGRSGRSSSTSIMMVEGLLGLLLHFARSSDPTVLEAIREHRLMMVFREHLLFPGPPAVKQHAAKGLQILSDRARLLAGKDLEPPLPSGWCASLMFLCRKAPPGPRLCPLHRIPCEENASFCLIEANAVRPLVELLDENSLTLQLAAVEALSTLLSEPTSLRAGVEELVRAEGIQRVFDIFFSVRPSELQDRTAWMVERILRVEEYAQKYSVDQGLVKALAEAFKNGSQVTKGLTKDALTNLKQISGVSGSAAKKKSQTR